MFDIYIAEDPTKNLSYYGPPANLKYTALWELIYIEGARDVHIYFDIDKFEWFEYKISNVLKIRYSEN